LPRLTRTMIFLFYTSHCSWDDRNTPSWPDFSVFLPLLALNWDLPQLGLPSSDDYRCELLYPDHCFFIVLRLAQKRCSCLFCGITPEKSFVIKCRDQVSWKVLLIFIWKIQNNVGVCICTSHCSSSRNWKGWAWRKNCPIVFGLILFFIFLVFQFWGYIVTFTKVLTIYHSWIHPLNHSPLSPPPPIPVIASTGFIFSFTYMNA
jgi:hypothetical protein